MSKPAHHESDPAATVLVTGGTGTLGRMLVPRLRAAGRRVRVMSRRPRTGVEGAGGPMGADGVEFTMADLATGDGVEAAVDGAGIVVHCAGSGSGSGDGEKARNLVRALTGTRVRHLVYISVVGADRVPQKYFREKFAGEQAVAGSGVPWTTLRATQFHDLVLTVARLPVVPAPRGVRFQPVDTDEVAARLADLTLGEPGGLVADMAGPWVYELAELVRGYLRAVDKHRPIVPIPLPGRAGKALRAGANLAPDHAIGVRTWEDFLAERV